MAGLHKSEIQNPVLNWVDTRLPILTLMTKEYGSFPTPKNFNYFWNFGALATINLMVMIASGIFLSMNYNASTAGAFDSVERIMRDVNYGWLLRYVHMNGASMFFIIIYIHIFRGMYYGSYKAPRELLWMTGVVLFLLLMATAFMGYVLPWGQMSYWGATVITNLFSAIPVVGNWIVTLLWGGFSVDNPTLNRFFSLHYLLPFVITGVVFLHVVALHITGSNNPLGIDVKSEQDTLPFHPYYTAKDSVGMAVYFLVFAVHRVLHPEPVRRGGQLHPRQPAADAERHRAGMVLPAVLRHPALGAGQAAGRHRHVRLHPGVVRAAVAGHLAGAQRALPADVSLVPAPDGAVDGDRSAWSARTTRSSHMSRWAGFPPSTISCTSWCWCRCSASSSGRCRCRRASAGRCCRAVSLAAVADRCRPAPRPSRWRRSDARDCRRGRGSGWWPAGAAQAAEEGLPPFPKTTVELLRSVRHI